MAEVRLYCGPQRSRRLRALDDLMREHWKEAIFLVPTRQLGARRTERLILEGELSGAWGRRVLTFEDFVRWLLESAHTDATPIDEFERTMLLQDAVAQVKAAGGLDVLGAAGDTPGFLTHMQRMIAQLKEAGVDPAEFRRRTSARRHASPLDRVVGDVYAAYQSMLIEQRLYDRQGIYWEANDLCRRERPEVLKNVRVLLLDGFDDFTLSEFRLLETLERHLDLLAFGLNYDSNPSRRDVYRLTANTAERIRARFQANTITFEAAPPESYTKYASANLFWRDKPTFIEGLRPDLEVQPCPGLIAEVEHVGRRVKSLLLEGVPTDAVAVIYRDIKGVGATVRSVFGEFGIPVRVVRPPRLSESAVCGFLLDFLEAVDRWDREKVVEILSSHWFRPEEQPDSPYLGAFPSLTRLAQIVTGYPEWNDRLKVLLNRIKKVLESDEDGPDDPDRADMGLFQRYLRHMPDAPAAVEALFKRFNIMADIFERLPRQGSVCEHILAIEQLIDACGIPGAVKTHPVAELRKTEASALETLRQLLTRIYSWCESDRDGAAIPRSDFVIRLRKALDGTTYEPAISPRGVVSCLDAEASRGLRFDHVFFCGVNEGEIPRPAPANAVYSDEDLEELEEAGVPIDSKRGRADREALLFHRMLDVPRRNLVITYHTLSVDGKEMRRSPYVEDLLELFPAEAGVLKPPIAASDFVPKPGEVASVRDLRNAAFAHSPALQRLFSEELRGIKRAAQLEERRHLPVPFDAYDGVLTDTALLARLAERFSPDHIYSVSQLEAYAACPFAYFANRVLGILEIEPPSEGFDTRMVGIVLHDVLQAFHHHYRGKSVIDIPQEEASQVITDMADELLRRDLRYNLAVSPGVAAVIQRQVDATLQRYLRQSRNEDEAPWKPSHFELTFGEYRKSFFDPKDRPDPVAIETPAGKVLFKGRIDRVDLDGNRARIIDYKTGTLPSASAADKGLSLQLPLYALAVEQVLLEGVVCEKAIFLQLGRANSVEGLGEKKWPERREAVLNAVADYIHGIRGGVFPPAPRKDGCSYCPARRACRHEQARIERKGAKVADEADA